MKSTYDPLDREGVAPSNDFAREKDKRRYHCTQPNCSGKCNNVFFWRPKYCPLYGWEAPWLTRSEIDRARQIKEDMKRPPLPKLTLEALTELGIKWPEWATCAGVHAAGRLLFFEQCPRLNTSIGGWDYYGFDPIPKMSDTNNYFDYSDWQNSLIPRPAKATCSAEHEDFSAAESKQEFPAWFKVGEIVISNGKLRKIIAIDKDIARIDSLELKPRGFLAGVTDMKPVRWRPYDAGNLLVRIGLPIVSETRGRAVLESVFVVNGVEFVKIRLSSSGDQMIMTPDILLRWKTIEGIPFGLPEIAE